MGIELAPDSWQVLVAFALYLVGVIALGAGSHYFLKRGDFVGGYFLGHRGLGSWVLALTVAATAISGGTFMGFPSLIYTNGWIMALWICSYMVVPITTMALMGKRINQVARIAGSVTVPDVLRDRYESPALGILASLLILFFLCFNLVAQFKGGGLVLKEAMRIRPSPATFLPDSTRVDEQKNLVLSFRLPDGQIDTQKVPLPGEKFTHTIKSVNEEARQVEVLFHDDSRQVRKLVPFPPRKMSIPWLSKPVETGYIIGLAIFALTVIAYTTYGGYWAVTLTDLLAGLVMLAGVLLMALLAVNAVEAKNGYTGLAAATEHLREITPPDGQKGDLVTGPGPKAFLPLGMAFSFFLMWSLMAAGQPSGMVRLMSYRDVPSLKKALFLVSFYYILTYVALLVIFICARAIYPTEYLRDVGSEGVPDSIMPAMARRLAPPLLAGLLLAAPYAAIMSTVAAFLLMISSSLVRDIYQRTINPNASQRTLRVVSYTITALVGVVVMLGALNPPDFLQYIIVFTGSGQGCAFLVPMLLALYWRRATRQGVLAGMLGGFLTVFVLYALGWIDSASQSRSTSLARWLQDSLTWLPGWGEKRLDSFAPLYPGNVDPLVWGLLASLLLTVGVSRMTEPRQDLVRKFFPGE